MGSELVMIPFIQVILLYIVLVQGDLVLYCFGLMGKSCSGTSSVASPAALVDLNVSKTLNIYENDLKFVRCFAMLKYR